MKRRQLLSAALATLAGASTAAIAQSATTEKPPLLQVWKDPSCGCCGDWVKHLQASGFLVQVIDTGNVAARKHLGMPDTLGSCHTARIGGYVIEGHVPARDILRLLREKPNALGLAVPGLPIGSPGLDGPGYKGRREPYCLLLVQSAGRATVFQSHRG